MIDPLASQHRAALHRVCVRVHDPGAVDVATLANSVRTVARPMPASFHLVVGPAANAWFAELKSL